MNKYIYDGTLDQTQTESSDNFWFKYDLDRSRLLCTPTLTRSGIQTYDLRIMSSTFHHLAIKELILGSSTT